MSSNLIPLRKRVFTPIRKKALAHAIAGAAASLWAFAAADAGAASQQTASLTRTVTVDAPAAEVWSLIGPFCAVKEWLPTVGTCRQNDHTPPTRTVISKDGASAFIETQIARDERHYFYTYTFRASPIPVTRYKATIAVRPSGHGRSLVTWSATYLPNEGKDAAARDALAAVYEAGLGAIKNRFAKPQVEIETTSW